MNDENKNADGEIIHYDEWGNRYVIDEAGNQRPPMYAPVISTKDGWTDYDTSQGHCGLCGKLTCRGSCFK